MQKIKLPFLSIFSWRVMVLVVIAITILLRALVPLFSRVAGWLSPSHAIFLLILFLTLPIVLTLIFFEHYASAAMPAYSCTSKPKTMTAGYPLPGIAPRAKNSFS
jgi:hypothetical protein